MAENDSAAPAPLDPLTDLDDVFTLDENVPQKWRGVYEAIVVRLRRESSHLELQTVQLLLLERIAHNYVVLRIKEDLSAEAGGFAHATAQKEYNTFWMSMTVEFNKMLRASSVDEKKAATKAAASILNEVINKIEDPVARKKAFTDLQSKLQEANL